MRKTPELSGPLFCAGFLSLLVFLGHSSLVQRERWCASALCGLLNIGLITAVQSRLSISVRLGLLLLLLLLILLHLRLLRGHDAEIVFGVLQIVLGHHTVSGGVRITSQLQILLEDV